MKRRHQTSPNREGRGLLNGLLYCGHCGQPMYAAAKAQDSSNDPVYCCSTYNTFGSAKKGSPHRGCQRNLVHQGQILPFLIEKIQELVLAPANLARLRAEVDRQLDQRSRDKAPPVNTAKAKANVAKLDKDIAAAAAELKRTPADLYDLVVADLRELQAERERAAASLEAATATRTKGQEKYAPQAERAIEAIQRLAGSLKSIDRAVVREALNRICARIDLWFEHTQSEKQTRSYFERGIIIFREPSELFGRPNKLR